MGKIRKTILINLLGETRKEEKKRLLKAKLKAIREGKTPTQVRNISKLAGTTAAQRARARRFIAKYSRK